MRLLIVDDDEVFREELAELLGDDGHSVTAVASVPKALEFLEHEEVELVLTDLKMPRHGGLELLREVRARWPRTLVVVVTGYATVETALAAMKLGAFDYVQKPFRIEQVRETLRLAAQEHEFESPRETLRDPVREAVALAAGGGLEVLFLGSPTPPETPHLHAAPLDPANPSALLRQTEEFVAGHPNAAVVVAGADRWLEGHRAEDIVAILDQTRACLAGHGPLRVAFHPGRVAPAVAAALAGAVTADETHATLEALANPIRRKVLQRVGEGPATFGEAMAAAGLDDSPKMAFHVRRLVDAGLLRHEGETYRLTARGDAATRLLAEALFLPPADDGGNLAFPGRRAPSRSDRA